MKIVVLDAFVENPGDLSWDWLSTYGEFEVFDHTDVNNEAQIIERIGNAEVAITNKTPITSSIIDACSNLNLVSVLATGYNIVDTDYARKHNINVCNVPAYSTDATSQHAIALLLEMTNHVGLHNDSVRAKDWQNSREFAYWKAPLIELAGKTLGIIGLGAIGKQTAKVARSMNMNVVVYTPHPSNEWSGFVNFVSLDELFTKSDAIVLHCPLKADNKELINAENIAKMKDGVLIVNNARGGLINEQDLANALNSGKVAAAAVDVVSTEPISADNPLLCAKNCIITPHISWTPIECRKRIMDITENNIKEYLNGHPINIVNLA